jgi:hypothetical protein
MRGAFNILESLVGKFSQIRLLVVLVQERANRARFGYMRGNALTV